MNNNRGFALVCNKQGMALVVALLTSFLLLALVASLFWIIASTSKQSEYAKNSAIALNLAEAGTADAIYRLNYCTGTDPAADLYPFLGTYIPFDLTSSDTFSLSGLPELPSPPAGLSYAPYGIKRNLNNGYYVVGLINDLTGPDTLISVGVYKAVRRILTVPLRGNNDIQVRHPVTPTLPFTQGISEAFNKHVIYANTITTTGTPTVNGNIVYATTCGSPISGAWTKTQADPALFGVPDFTAPAPLPSPTWDRTYTDGDRPGPVAFTADYLGSTYNPLTGTYTFPAGILAGANLEFVAGLNPGPVVDISSLTAIYSSIKTDGALTLSGTKTVGPGVIFQPSTTITVSPLTIITGDLIVRGVPLILSRVTVTGAVLCDNAITLSGIASTINASASTKEAAILMDSAADDTITISASPTITLGPNQKAAVIAYSTVGAGVSVNATLIPALSFSGQASIVAHAGPLNNANINIGNSAPANVNGLIYAYSSGFANTGNITLDTLTVIINGALVADGTVTLKGGTLNYGTPAFIGVSSSSDIFPGFSGGRRAYVPVWQGWSLR